MKTLSYDILVIGTGVAGLSLAAHLAEKKSGRIALVTREKDPKLSNTYWAQGGIADPRIGAEDLIQDLQKASSHTSSQGAIEHLLKYGPQALTLLLERAQTDFKREEGKGFAYTQEAAHSHPRILYSGDFTGRSVEISLLNYLQKFSQVDILQAHTAIDLITPKHHGSDIAQRYEEAQVVGAYVFSQEDREVHRVFAKKTVLATGGIGALYLHHSNSEGARGDGHAMASRAGCELVNMEFIQFHPTTFYNPADHRRFLISEALRGEGARLINGRGESFMKRYHPEEELASRDIVARAINDEMISSGVDCVYLDISFKEERWIRERFPTIYEYCLQRHVDITREPIPVVPAAHYTCGGIKTDLTGKTNLRNLYAIGEVACTGLHGANRLASTSLLEGVTWGYLAAQDIAATLKTTQNYDPEKIKLWVKAQKTGDLTLVQQDLLFLKQTLWNYVGLLRSPKRLQRAYGMMLEFMDEVGRFYKNTQLDDSLIGLRNAAHVALRVIEASSRNKISQGCFYRIKED